MKKKWVFILQILILLGSWPALSYASYGDDAPQPGDPYQNAYNEEKLKTYFSRRLANVQKTTDYKFPVDTANPNRTKDHPKGVFLRTDQEAELKQLFQNVARRIQLKLIE